MEELKKYDPEVLKRIQELELSIYKDIYKLCKKHDIKFYAYSGTAIGAVRHNGFIPWDDDIDLVFFRDEYERFKEVAKRELPDRYDLLTPEGIDDYFLLFSKVILKGTAFDEWWADQVSFTQGIFVDIFILDNLPDSKIKKIYYKNVGRLIRKLVPLATIKFTDYGLPTRVIASCVRAVLKLLRVSPVNLKKRAHKMITRYNDQETKELYDVTGRYFTYVYQRDMFEPAINFKFEDTEIPMPKEYDPYLHVEYENPMELPPVGDRFNHVEAEIDFGKYK